MSKTGHAEADYGADAKDAAILSRRDIANIPGVAACSVDSQECRYT